MEIKGSSVPDKNGSPMNVSAVITYQVMNPMAFLFNVDNAKGYIHDQGSEVLKKIMSRFDYMSNDPNVPSLLDDTVVIGKYTKVFLSIGKCMKELLQAKCQIAGITILRMELMEFSYQSEMTKALLQVQQAKAKIDARKLIVKGGAMIVKDALIRLEEEGIEMSTKTKYSLTKDLMLVTCGESGPPNPVITL